MFNSYCISSRPLFEQAFSDVKVQIAWAIEKVDIYWAVAFLCFSPSWSPLEFALCCFFLSCALSYTSSLLTHGTLILAVVLAWFLVLGSFQPFAIDFAIVDFYICNLYKVKQVPFDYCW